MGRSWGRFRGDRGGQGLRLHVSKLAFGRVKAYDWLGHGLRLAWPGPTFEWVKAYVWLFQSQRLAESRPTLLGDRIRLAG